MYEDLVILKVRRLVISVDQRDLIDRFGSELNQERLIKFKVIQAVLHTGIGVDTIGLEMLTKRERRHLRGRFFSQVFEIRFRLGKIIDLFIGHHGLRQNLAHDAFEFIRFDRLTDESVKALRKEHLLGGTHGICGKCNDRRFSVLARHIRTDPLHGFDAIHAAHHVIHKYDIERHFPADIDRFLSGKHCRYFHTVVSEDALSDDQVHRLVINDQRFYALAYHSEAGCLFVVDTRIEDRDDREAVERLLHDTGIRTRCRFEVTVGDDDNDHVFGIFFDQFDVGSVLFFRHEQVCHMDRVMKKF